MPRPPHSSLFDNPNNIWWWVRSSLCSLLHSPVTPSLLGPNILLSTLFSNTLSLCSSLNVWDQVSHPYKTEKNYSSVYLNRYIFEYKSGRQKTLGWMPGGITGVRSALNFFMHPILIC
jgi:hypothetical protein